MEIDFETIYRERAREYNAMVSAEDCDGNLRSALHELVELPGARVVEVGVGTGRLTRLMLNEGARVTGVERSSAMLKVAMDGLRRWYGQWDLTLGDARDLTVAQGAADLAVAGWVFGHFRAWMPAGWKQAVGESLQRMYRSLARGGALVVFETLGTGTTEPAPPNDALGEYYQWLEQEWGMKREQLRTDYQFASPEQAIERMGFFFGPEMGDAIRTNGWSRVPEWTGMWWKRNL